MRIKKVSQSSGLIANVSNTQSNSQTDTYSCDYINEINSYSTDEIDTGKIWIDGKPIYRKVVEKNITLAVGDNTFAHNISNISEVTSVSYTFEPGWDSTMRGTEAYLAKNGIGARIYTTSITIESDSLTWTGIFRFVIEYTKTTD